MIGRIPCAYNRRVPIWARLVVAAAALRVAVATAFYLAGIYNPGLDAPLARPLRRPDGQLRRAWPAADCRRPNDVRAAWLGGILLLLAVPLTSRFLSQTPFAFGNLPDARAGRRVPAGVPLAVRVEFPSRLEGPHRHDRRAAAAVRRASALPPSPSTSPSRIWPWTSAAPRLARSWLATGAAPASVYWPGLLLLSALARACPRCSGWPHGRRRPPSRSHFPLGGLAARFHAAVRRDARSKSCGLPTRHLSTGPRSNLGWRSLLFGPLALIPFITAYSVCLRPDRRDAPHHPRGDSARPGEVHHRRGHSRPVRGARRSTSFQYRTDPLIDVAVGRRPWCSLQPYRRDPLAPFQATDPPRDRSPLLPRGV